MNRNSDLTDPTDRPWSGVHVGDQVTIGGTVFEFMPNGAFAPVSMITIAAPSGTGTHTSLSPTRQEKRRAARQEKKMRR